MEWEKIQKRVTENKSAQKICFGLFFHVAQFNIFFMLTVRLFVEGTALSQCKQPATTRCSRIPLTPGLSV